MRQCKALPDKRNIGVILFRFLKFKISGDMPMRLALQFMLVIAFATLASPLQAAPRIIYYDWRDQLVVYNDIPGSIINIKSPFGALNAPSFPNGPLPSPAVVDTGDLPTFLGLLNVPSGSIDLGRGVMDFGTPISELSFDWYESFGRPANPGWVELVTLDTPEPTTASLVSIAVIAFTAASRRRRQRTEANFRPKQEQA